MSEPTIDLPKDSTPPHKHDALPSEGAHGGIEISGQANIDGDMVGGDKVVDDILGASNDMVGGNKYVEQDAGNSYDEVRGNKYVSWTGVKIGTFVLPIRFLLALLIVAALAAVVLWWQLVPSQMPTGTKNVAIAEFGETDSNGNVTSSTRGAALSQWLFTRMSTFVKDKTNLPPDVDVTLWQDSMSLLQKRSNIGIIRTEQEAAKKADELNAHLVVYGNLKPGQALETFVPLFYVNQKLLAQKTGEADELTGTQVFGADLQVQYPLNDEYLDLQLQPRGNALVWFVRGLGFDLVGEYGHGYQTFCQADKVLSNWKENEGREVLYYFLGREALFLARTDADAQGTLSLRKDLWGEAEACKPFQNAVEANHAAETWFRKAQSANANYARAYFGLGQVYAQRANNVLRTGAHDPATLQQARQNLNDAIGQYQTAVPLLQTSAGEEYAPSYVDLKTRAALGSSYILLGQSYLLESNWKPALDNFDQADTWLASLLENGVIPETEARLLAQTSFARASVQRLRAHVMDAQRIDVLNNNGLAADAADLAGKEKKAYGDALVNLQKCITLADPNKTVDEFLKTDTFPKCQKMQGEINQALASLP